MSSCDAWRSVHRNAADTQDRAGHAGQADKMVEVSRSVQNLKRLPQFNGRPTGHSRRRLRLRRTRTSLLGTRNANTCDCSARWLVRAAALLRGLPRDPRKFNGTVFVLLQLMAAAKSSPASIDTDKISAEIVLLLAVSAANMYEERSNMELLEGEVGSRYGG